MRSRIVKAVLIVLTCVLVFVAAIFGAILTISAPATACDPSTTLISDSKVSVGTGSAVDAYFKGLASNDALERKANAALIIELGHQRKLSDHSIAIAVATSLQESGLRNLNYGDRDSLGLFQQRPSVGAWGTAEQILNPTHAINAFYDRLVKIPDRDTRSMISVAIQIQVPSIVAYTSTWHWDALANELVTGSDTSGVCSVGGGDGTVKLPLNPGYTVGDGFDDPNYVGIKPHKGVDLYYPGGSLGKPVFAVRDGLVIQSGKGQGCFSTNDVIIKHADGTETGYLHMNGSAILVGVGDHVTAGQRIGAINMCGFATGPHLHFEAQPASPEASWMRALHHVSKYGNTYIDPIGYLAHFGVKLLP